jgi:hypothetical protein
MRHQFTLPRALGRVERDCRVGQDLESVRLGFPRELSSTYKATCRRCSAAKKTPQHHSPKPDTLPVLAIFLSQDRSWPT